jgi:methionyl-tRNA formyltransferase
MAHSPQAVLPRSPLSRRLRVAFFGTPALAVPTLDALVASDVCDVVGVVSQPDKPAGRGRSVRPTPVAARARELDLPLRQPRRIRTGEFPEWLESLDLDVAVVIAYGRILTSRHLETPRYGCVNVHASLLPAWRGAGPIQWSIMAGDAVTGVTTMWMEEGLDTGPMLLVSEEPIHPDDTAATLGPRLARLGAELAVRTLEELVAGRLRATAQPAEGVSHAPLLSKEHGRLVWEESADACRNRLRGVSPWPGAWAPWRDKALKVHAATVESAAGVPGTVLAADDSGILVACGEGALRLTRVQPPNKKAMGAADFLRGYPLEVGERLSG